MKRELKEKVVEVARKFVSAEEITGRCRVPDGARVLPAPDVYWVEAWISVGRPPAKD